MIFHRRWLVLAACATAFALLPADGSAQRQGTGTLPTDPRLSQLGSTPAAVLERLRESGMTRQQVRSELQRRGYDPFLADPYFDIIERESGVRGSDTFLDALGRTGMTARDTTVRQDADRTGLDRADSDRTRLDLEMLFGRPERESALVDGLPVFGVSFFSSGSGAIDDADYGPVDSSYRLGAGDEVNVILTGAVQDAYALRVSREGTLVVPEAGELVVRGLTVEALESRLRARFRDVYASGLTNVTVSLGRVRSIQVYVIGDVAQPGPLQVSGLSTVLGALYRAGGPANTGSFREVEIRRNNELVRRLDLYDYLLRGNSEVDLRLQHGDVVFVPPYTRRVRLEGAVKRPAIYELADGDGLRDAIRFAGGPQAEAALRRVRIDRILPPSERTPGVDRTVIDVDAVQLLAPGEPDVPLRDGDRITVLSVVDEQRNLVTIVGEVRRPGEYAWSPGTTLGAVIERASGLTEQAYEGRVHVFRVDRSTGDRRLLSVDPAGDPRSVTLEERDSVVVFSRSGLRPAEQVTIGGLVQQPGEYPLHEGATVNDIILRAGGYAEGAYRIEAYVARPVMSTERAAQTAQTFRVALAAREGGGPASVPTWAPDAGEFVLEPGDHIEIRRAPGYETPRTVVVSGEVVLPGPYVLETRDDRVSAVIAAAGGLTPEAYPPGLHVVRKGSPVSANAADAIGEAGSPDDLLLQDGDTVHVPRFEPTILVTGAVVHDQTRVLYRSGMDIEDVINEAGGFKRTADRNRLTVTYQNGQRGTVERRSLQPDRQPVPRPGSTIFVPERPAGSEGIGWPAVISQIVAAAGAIATLIIAFNSQGT